MARICFLFNHDQGHQVAHSLPIALALSEASEHVITLAVGDERLEQNIRDMAGPAIERCNLIRLDLHRGFDKFLDRCLGGILPTRKILLYRNNLDVLRGFDALVVSEKTTLLLKSRYGLTDLKIIHTRHGAGDRAIGFGKESAQFSLVLVSGKKIADRLMAEADVKSENIRLTGYPKFDAYADNRIANPFSDPARPTVLYAPHPSPKLSSYYTMGLDILRAFAGSDRYNLIFAPHVMLFQRKWTVTIDPPAIRRVPQVPAEIAARSNILVDLGSVASSDMSYTNLADCYIGDVSSQVYEYLINPRPVLHLDAHNTPWQDDPAYGHWQAGPVAKPGDEIIAAVDSAFATHSEYRTKQDAMLAETFSITKEPSSRRAAKAIGEYLMTEGRA